MMQERKGYPVYPLTAAQKLHFYYQKYCPRKQVLNIGTSLTIEAELDWGLLKECIYQAYERCESMRLRFTQDEEGNCFQYIAEKEEREIEFFDFTGWAMEAAEDKLTEWTRTPFEQEDSPMNRIVMIRMPDGFNGVYALVHHMTMDAQSLIIFLRDIIELYCSKAYEDVECPKGMSSYIEQLQKDLAYEAGCRAKVRDAEFFQQMIEESEPVFNSIYGSQVLEQERRETGKPGLRAATSVSGSVDATVDVFHLEGEPTSRLMDFCEEYHVSLVCLLMMGLRTMLQKENGNEDVSINTTIARRATVKEKKSGGTRIHCFPFRTIVAEDESFLDGVLKIRDGQNRMFRHANYNPVEYFNHRTSVYPDSQGRSYEPLSLTYQPMSMKEKGLEKLGDIRYKTKWYSNGAAAHALYLTVMHRPEDNGLDFHFEHQLAAVDRDKLEYLYYYLCRILFKGVENPSLSVGEIMKSV